MRVLWRWAKLWRLVFKGKDSRFWLDRRRGDGHLLGDPDGSFGTLGDDIAEAGWTVSLDRVRRRYRDGRLGEPYEFAHCYLGLQLEYPDDLRKLPRSASLQLLFIAIEAALSDVLAAEQQSEPSSPPMNLHLHMNALRESERPAATEPAEDAPPGKHASAAANEVIEDGASIEHIADNGEHDRAPVDKLVADGALPQPEPQPKPVGDWKPWLERYRSQKRALIEWATAKYGNDVPSRDILLKHHRCEFGPIKGISERAMRPVREALASDLAKRGGAPTHTVHG
jgi:hypothetical protein